MATATAASKLSINAAKLQTALQHSFRPLRRRRLGHIGPNYYSNDLDKWGRKKTNGVAPSLAAGGRRIPAPRASLILGGGGSSCGNRRNGQMSDALNGNNDHQMNGQHNGNSTNERQKLSLNGNKLNDQNNNPATHHQENNRINNNSKNNNNNDDESITSNGYSSDLIVVLDMDECLIHSQFLSDQIHDKYRQDEERPPASSSTSAFHHAEEAESIISTSCESFRISLPDGDLVHVNKRPNLDLFLREITGKFETYIFTAAMEVYASPVLKRLDPAGEMFQGIFYRDSCAYDPDLNVYSKDLCQVLHQRKMLINASNNNINNDYETPSPDECHGTLYLNENNRLQCDERRVVLVDNNPLSFLPNPSNGILVSSFYDDPKDDTLEAVMELLNELDETDDVRPILDEKFGLKDALRDVMKESSGWR